MLTRELLKQIQKLLTEDEHFANEFRKVSSIEKMVELLNNKRLAITKEEAQELTTLSRKACAEISEQMSESVCGGVCDTRGATNASTNGCKVGLRDDSVEPNLHASLGNDVLTAITTEGENLYNRYFEAR